MKKNLLFCAAAVLGLGSLISCTGNSCNAQPVSAESGAVVTADAAGVVDLKNDNKYRPGMKVKKLTILDFNATWCGPCKQFSPAFHQAAAKFGGKVDFVSIDTDANPNTAAAFGIRSIPTVIFIYPNGKTKTYIGTGDLLPANRFISLVQQALK